jgi:hypothetical protein
MNDPIIGSKKRVNIHGASDSGAMEAGRTEAAHLRTGTVYRVPLPSILSTNS